MEYLQIKFDQPVCDKKPALYPKPPRNDHPVETKTVQLSDEDTYLLVQKVVQELYQYNYAGYEKRSFQGVKFIKHLAIYLCHVVLGHSMRKIARGIGLDRTSVSYACRKIEDKRDDYEAEQFISLCERLIGLLISSATIKAVHQLHVV
ncbi:MAG: hypothetical protein JJ858_07515 [Rhizobiaceae bacterium]|nr:hypothetical protein [Rhizobiaceae bacterium]